MDSRISKDSSGTLAEQFLGKGEIPIYLELKFNVGVDISFGLQHFGTTAPFDKKCGMNIGGMFERSQNKLGPMLCRGSFDELGDLPHLGEAVPGGSPVYTVTSQGPRGNIWLKAVVHFNKVCVLGTLCRAP